MNYKLAAALGAAAFLAASHVAAQVTFYSQEGLRGQPFTVNGTVPNFDALRVQRSRVVGRRRARSLGSLRARELPRPLQRAFAAASIRRSSAMGLNDRVSSVRRVQRESAVRVRAAASGPAAIRIRTTRSTASGCTRPTSSPCARSSGRPSSAAGSSASRSCAITAPNVPGRDHRRRARRRDRSPDRQRSRQRRRDGDRCDRRCGRRRERRPPSGGRVYAQDVQRCAPSRARAGPSTGTSRTTSAARCTARSSASRRAATITVNGRGEPRV